MMVDNQKITDYFIGTTNPDQIYKGVIDTPDLGIPDDTNNSCN